MLIHELVKGLLKQADGRDVTTQCCSHKLIGKDKLGSSKSKERGVCEKNHKEDVIDGNGNSDNSSNGKTRVGKKKPNRKRDKLKCFLYNSPLMLKKCLKKFVLKEKQIGKALVLRSSARGVEAKEAESEKKPLDYFLCHGPHRLRRCPNKSIIEGDNGANKEPKELGSNKGNVEAKKAKRSKKKRVKGFLYRGPHKEEVSLSSNLGEKVAMKIVKLGPMRLNSSEASKLARSSTRLPPIEEVAGASNFKEKEVMQVV
ncbi:hypothetical protein J1N35_041137 [Gossypium stocksii]|uniref:Uncharacterized protein n=1 Tax=Gossypium stocksii TaxID=47602 RepID=A0A9D3UEW3_9ROSI|nr:hypothetical protein J1N35_041137 [Gossypium stocksii]